MDNTYDCTSDLPDNFDPSWDEPVEQDWEDWRDECYEDDMYHDASVPGKVRIWSR